MLERNFKDCWTEWWRGAVVAVMSGSEDTDEPIVEDQFKMAETAG